MAAIAFARGELFNECADHLDQNVTDDKTELSQIPFVQKQLRRQAERWFDKAHALESEEGGN